MTFGDTIKILRASKNLTQKQLAQLSGISTVEINHIENDKHKPTALTVNKLAKGLEVEAKVLWELR